MTPQQLTAAVDAAQRAHAAAVDFLAAVRQAHAAALPRRPAGDAPRSKQGADAFRRAMAPALATLRTAADAARGALSPGLVEAVKLANAADLAPIEWRGVFKLQWPPPVDALRGLMAQSRLKGGKGLAGASLRRGNPQALRVFALAVEALPAIAADLAAAAEAGDRPGAGEAERGEALARMAADVQSYFRDDDGMPAPLAALLETLRARLDVERVRALARLSDPAPTHAKAKRRKGELNPDPDPVEGEWLMPPRSLTELARLLRVYSSEKAKTTLEPYGLRTHGKNRQAWTVRLDLMPENLRAKLERA